MCPPLPWSAIGRSRRRGCCSASRHRRDSSAHIVLGHTSCDCLSMPKTTTSLETPLRAQLDRLAAFEPVDLRVISLYLDMQPNEHGRDQFRTFVRKVLGERQRTYPSGTPGRQSFDADVDRITTFLDENIDRSANGLTIFACHGANLFETMQMNAAIDDHWLFVGAVPHLYPLARLTDRYPR